MTPSESGLEGGTEIVVTGTGFVFPGFCKFGAVVSRATYVVEDTLICTAPEQKDPGLFSFGISDGKGDFQDTGVLFHCTVGMIPFCDEEGALPSWCRPRLANYNVSPQRVPQDTEAVINVYGSLVLISDSNNFFFFCSGCCFFCFCFCFCLCPKQELVSTPALFV